MLQKLRYKAVRAEVRVFLHGQMRKAIDGLKKDGLKKKSIRLANSLGAETWRYFCITDVTKVCWARCKWEGLWLLLEQEVGGRLSTQPHFRSSPGQKQTGGKDVEVGLVLQIKISRDISYIC